MYWFCCVLLTVYIRLFFFFFFFFWLCSKQDCDSLLELLVFGGKRDTLGDIYKDKFAIADPSKPMSKTARTLFPPPDFGQRKHSMVPACRWMVQLASAPLF